MRVTRWQNAHRTLDPDPGGVARRMPQWLHQDQDVVVLLELGMPSHLVFPMTMRMKLREAPASGCRRSS
jgi:hypothetical protein